MAGTYNLYRGVGDSLANVDFTTPVATGLTGATATLALSHAVSTKYTYVLRPVLGGMENPNVSCRVLFETDGTGAWAGAKPAAPIAVAAEAIAAGKVRVTWQYQTPAGRTAPATFGLYYGTDPYLVSGTPLASVTYAGDGRYSHDFTLTDGVAYWFAVTGRTAAVTGPPAVAAKDGPLSNVAGPVIADATAPAAPTITASSTWT